MPRQAPNALSKSRYLSGLQCSKRLWTEIHAPELVPPVDAATQARFDQGHEVGRLATQLFPGGLEIARNSRRWDVVVAATERALSQRRPLYEAAFRSGGGACRVDILVPTPDGRWDLYEVKSSTGVKEVHYQDVALQAYVVAGAGIDIRDYYLVHIDSSYVRHGDVEPERLFQRVRVSEEVRARQPAIGERLTAMQTILANDTRPEIAIGRHCLEPYTCRLKEECWAFLPPHNVLDLVGGRQQAFELLSAGILELSDTPDSTPLDRRQTIQLQTLRSGSPHADREALGHFLASLTYPLYYFDVETIASAVPLYEQSRPYQQVPFLFSIHRVEAPGETARHYAFLVDVDGDPRPEFLRAVRASLGAEGTIVAYNAAFERRVLTEAAESVPEFQQWAFEIGGRFVDLLIPFRSFSYYHPEQRGSASLKAVLTPLTGMSYSELEITDGEMASREYLRVISNDIDPIERAKVLRQLEAYCSLDTLGMVGIVESLHELAREGPKRGRTNL